MLFRSGLVVGKAQKKPNSANAFREKKICSAKNAVKFRLIPPSLVLSGNSAQAEGLAAVVLEAPRARGTHGVLTAAIK